MSRELDKKYHDLALSALHNGLAGCQIHNEHVSVGFEKEEILAAFKYSGDILRSNQGEDYVRTIADGVFESCIRLARCVFFPEEARKIFLQGKGYVLDENGQLDNLRRSMQDLERSLQEG